MFQTSSPESRLGAAIYLSERIYHASVRKVRQKHGNALLSILVTIGQTALFTLAFYIMFAILPIRAAGTRGDFFHLYHVRRISFYGAYSDREGDIGIREIDIGDDAACADEHSDCNHGLST